MNNNNPPINAWSNGSDPIGISLFANSAFSFSTCTCIQNPRFSDPRCAHSRALAPSGYIKVHVTGYHVTATIPLVGVSGFTMIVCIHPLELWYANSRPPLFSLHLSCINSWVAHSLFLISGNRLSRFRDVWCSKFFAIPKPEPRNSERGYDQRIRFILIQRLWSLREIAFRDFGVLDALCSWYIKSRSPKLRCHLSSTLVVPRVA